MENRDSWNSRKSLELFRDLSGVYWLVVDLSGFPTANQGGTAIMRMLIVLDEDLERVFIKDDFCIC